MGDVTHKNWMVKLQELKFGESMSFNSGPIDHSDIAAALDKMSGYYKAYTLTNHGDQFYILRVPSSGTKFGGEGNTRWREDLWHRAMMTCYRSFKVADLVTKENKELFHELIWKSFDEPVAPSLKDEWGKWRKGK